MAGENLDLKIIIDTLLNAKGFQEAQAGLSGLTKATNTAAVAADKASGTERALGKELGGRRGAVADLTRVLLVSIGANRGAGEAAKFAGVGLMALETGAMGASAAMAGATLGIALLVPLLIQWVQASKDQNKEQEGINKKIKEVVPDLQRYAEQLKVVNESLRVQVAFEHQKALNEETAELRKLTEAQSLATQNLQKGQIVQIQSVEEIANARARMADLTEAQALGLTVAEMYEARIKSQTKTFQAQDDAIDKLAERDLFDANARMQASADMAAQNEEQARDAIRDMNAFGRKQQEQAKKEREADSELTLAQIENRRLLAKAEEELAARRRIQNVQMVQDALFAIGTLFGKNKAAMIAQALVDTYAGAAKAFSQFGVFGFISGAAIIAQGLSYVANIRKQEIGFDDPVNDMLAARLGRKFATDVLAHINAGFAGGLRDLSGGSSAVYHNTTINRGTTVNLGGVHGFIGSQTEFEKRLVRTITRANRIEGRTNS